MKEGRMKYWSRSLLIVLLPAIVSAAVPWNESELRDNLRVVPPGRLPLLSPLSQDHINYLSEIRQTCDFVARYQFSDSAKPDSFGGIIEAEHMPTTIETDNTQEAIWVWSRWYELTGRDDYRTNIRRAWFYVLQHPAYREGTGQYVWYSVWNCGLGFFSEMKYREVYGDSSYLAYADTCRQYCFANPLNFASSYPHGNVTALAAGMMYRYAVERGNQAMRDTALLYGNRVKTWVEQLPSRLRTGNWAMSGGTLMWGMCNSIWKDDTVAGKNWLAVFGDSVPYFMPSGQWNCSWNIWDANGFRAAAEINREPRYLQYHQRLTDTLLARDQDDDGGIPATWTDPQNQDQTWVSMYLDFMGMDRFTEPMYDYDAGVIGITPADPNRIYLPGDSLTVSCSVTNFGRDSLSAVPVIVRLPAFSSSADYADSADSRIRNRTNLQSAIPFPSEDTVMVDLGFLQLDTVSIGPVILSAPGVIPLLGFTNLGNDQNRGNDTAYASVKVWAPRRIAGSLLDSFTSLPVVAQVEFFLGNDTSPFRVATPDSLGDFTVTGIDSSFRVRVHPELPYPDRQWNVRILGDTSLTFAIPPAHLLLVDNDTLSRWESYYTSTFDTLNLSYCSWRRPTQGPIPISRLSEFRDDLIVWYTGLTRHATLDTTDMDSLSQFLDSGGRLFITGQDIGQELALTQFYRDRLHARLVDTTAQLYYAFGNRSDSLGTLFDQTQTAGLQGANNQTSRDEIAPDSLAHTFLFYDTLTAKAAGIYYRDPQTQSRVIYLGFGFEALNRPTGHPAYDSRVTFFQKCHNWLIGASGLAENSAVRTQQFALSIAPNPFTSHQPPATIHYSLPKAGDVGLKLYDISGKLVSTLASGFRPAGSYSYSLLAAQHSLVRGIYLLRMETVNRTLCQKLVKTR
jgi:hypothetical protein